VPRRRGVLSPSSRMLNWQVLTEHAELEAIAPEWDELAVANGLPMMSPACVLAWSRHLAPPGATFRALAVFEDARLRGLAPFYLDRDRRRLGLRLPGIELAGGLAPLAWPGRAREVGEALAAALASSWLCRGPVSLEGSPQALDWARGLADSWPGRLRPASRRYRVLGCPRATLEVASFEEWMSSKSANFRSSMRRLRRRFAAAGGTSRATTAATLREDVDTFMRLHASRWEGRGGSSFARLGPALGAALRDIGRTQLDDEGRFCMRLLELDGEPVTAQLFLAAGKQVHYINGGWDERFADLKPPMLAILDAVEDAVARGQTILDLGLGEQSYKLRFADNTEHVTWDMVIPADVYLPLTLLSTAPTRGRATLRNAVKSHIPESHMTRCRQLRERVHALERRSAALAGRLAAQPKRPGTGTSRPASRTLHLAER
jgi:CelD/BcsL family acetyltransferase involved in cellulose biosynthesis